MQICVFPHMSHTMWMIEFVIVATRSSSRMSYNHVDQWASVAFAKVIIKLSCDRHTIYHVECEQVQDVLALREDAMSCVDDLDSKEVVNVVHILHFELGNK